MIREMTAADIPGALEIEKTLQGRQWTGRAFEESLQQEYTFFYVAAEPDGSIAGYCCVERLYGEAEIVNVAVDPKLRRRGIGDELLGRVLKEEAAAGTVRVVLEVRRSNQAAICLYEKAGFTEIGIRKNFYEFPTEDALVMQLEMGQ